MGFYANGEMEEAGGIWASLIETEYRVINDYGTTLAWMDREAALQQSMDVLMLYTLVAMPLIDYIAYGPSMESLNRANKVFHPDSRLDNIERNRWSINGSPSLGNLPEAAGNPGGQVITDDENVANVGYDFGKLQPMLCGLSSSCRISDGLARLTDAFLARAGKAVCRKTCNAS